MQYQLICYPKCSTCQKAKKWLDDNNITYSEQHIKEQKDAIIAELDKCLA